MKIQEIASKIDSKEMPLPKLICDKDLCDIPTPLPGSDGVHFCLIISGKPASGKSSLAISLLTAKKDKRVYRGRFDHIITFVPSHSLKSLKENPFEDLDESKQNQELNEDNLQKAYELIQKYSNEDESTLLYLDDMASDLKQNLKVQELFNRIVLNRRHLKVSIIFLVQYFKSIPINVRKNSSHVILYKTLNKLENSAVFDEVLNLHHDDVDDVFSYVFDKKFNFLMIDINRGLFYKNFNQLVLTEK